MKDKKHFAGDNRGSNIGFVKMHKATSPNEFRGTPEEKKLIIGDENHIPQSSSGYVSLESDPGYQSEPGKRGQSFGSPISHMCQCCLHQFRPRKLSQARRLHMQML